MLFLFLIQFFVGLMWMTPVLVLCACYSLGILLLRHMIVEVRQESSRQALRYFLIFSAFDHYITAAAALGVASAISYNAADESPTWSGFLGGLNDDTAPGVAAILLTMMIVWLYIGTLLILIQKDMRPTTSVLRQLQWNPWLKSLVAISVVLSLSFGFLPWFLFLPMICSLNYLARFRRQANLMWTLKIAVHQGVPLGPEVLALSNGYWGSNRYRLQLLSENLDAGQALSTALERQPGLVPKLVLMQIRMGEETDMLGIAIENASMNTARSIEQHLDMARLQEVLAFAMLPLLVVPVIVGFLMYYIVPKFKKIFDDFGVELPAVTRQLIFSADLAVRNSPVITLLLMVVIYLVIRASLRGSETAMMPGFRWLTPRYYTPAILRAFAILVNNGRPFEVGLEAMRWSHPDPHVRQKLAKVHQQLFRGEDLWSSLQGQGIVRHSDVSLIRAADRVHNLPWVLEHLAHNIERKTWRNLKIIQDLLLPAIVMVASLVVLFIALGFFMPLVHLLHSLS